MPITTPWPALPRLVAGSKEAAESRAWVTAGRALPESLGRVGHPVGCDREHLRVGLELLDLLRW